MLDIYCSSIFCFDVFMVLKIKYDSPSTAVCETQGPLMKQDVDPSPNKKQRMNPGVSLNLIHCFGMHV